MTRNLILLTTASWCLIAAVPIGAQGYGWKNATISELKRGVWRGDHNAQLELGIRYETGSGVTTNLRRARELYRAAAPPSDGTDLIYAPPVRVGGSGRVISIGNGIKYDGLPEARARLAALERRLAQ